MKTEEARQRLLEKANALLDDYRNGEPIFDDDEIVEEDD